MLLHNLKKLDDDLRAWPDHALPLPSFLGVVDGFERVIEDRGLDHGRGSESRGSRRNVIESAEILRFSSRQAAHLRYLQSSSG